MIRAVAYYRVASPEDAEMGLQSQKVAVRAYAKDNGFEIAAEVEAIESGSVADRESLRRIKEEVDRTASEAILTRSIDRISRNLIEVKKAIESFGKVEVKGVEGMEHTKDIDILSLFK